MNLREARVALRARTLPDVLDLAIPFAVLGKRPLGIAAAAALGPVAALALVARALLGWNWLFVWLIVLGAQLFLQGAFTVVLGDLLFRAPRDVDARAALRRWAARLPTVCVATVGRLVILVASAVLVVVPFIQAPGTQFFGEAMLLEGANGARGRSRSRALVRHRGSFSFGLWAAGALTPALGAVMGDQLGNAAAGFVLQLGHPTGELFGDGGSGFAVVGALLALPIAAALRFLGYVDLRTRKEGWDVQLRFMQLVADAASGSGSAGGGPGRQRAA